MTLLKPHLCLLSLLCLTSASNWKPVKNLPRFRYHVYGMATQPPAGPSYLATSRGLFRLNVSENGSDLDMVKVWNHTTNFGTGGELSISESGLMLVTKFGLYKYAWYRKESDWMSLTGIWNKKVGSKHEFPAADETGNYTHSFSDNRYHGYAHPWRPGADGRIYVMLTRKASWPPFHEIPEDGTSTRYAIWSYDLDDGQWRRASPDLPNFRDKTLKTFTRGCGQCQGVSGFNDTMPTWSGLQQVKYGNGKLCKADKDPLDVPQCWKPQSFSLPHWGGNHTRGLYLRACHGELKIWRFVLSLRDNLTEEELEALPMSPMEENTWLEEPGEDLVIDASAASQLFPAGGTSDSTVTLSEDALLLNGSSETRGTQQNNQTQAAHAEYKVRFQPITDANDKRYVYLKAQATGRMRPHARRHCADVLVTGYFNQWHPRFELVNRPDGSTTFYAGNTNVDSVARCDDSTEAQPDTGIPLLEDGSWRRMTGPDTKYRKEGFTCGWGMSKIATSTDRKTLYSTGGSGQYYAFNEQKGWWLPLDEVGYGTARGFFTGMAQQRGEEQLVGPEGNYYLPKAVDSANCNVTWDAPLLAVPNPKDKSRVLGFFMELRTMPSSNCTGLPWGDGINEDQSLEEARAATKPKAVRRGHLWHPFQEERLLLKTLPIHLASYHPLNSQCQSEEVVSAFLSAGATEIVTCGYFPSLATPDAVVWLDAFTGAQLRSVALSNTVNVCRSMTGGLVAAGAFGIEGLDDQGSLWTKNTLGEVKAMSEVRAGRVAVISHNRTVAVISVSTGAILHQRFFDYSYVTAVEIFSDHRVALGAYTNNRATNAVQIARLETYSADLQTRLTQTWGQFSARQLDDSHNMADTRVYGLALDHSEKHIYVAGESAGGNTIYRWNGLDLQTLTARDTGSPMWMAKSDAHVGYVGRVRASDGRVLSGTFIAPILRSKQRLNSFRMKGSAMQYDQKSKSLYVMGTSTCCIPGRTAFTLAGQRVDGGDPAGYAGSDPSFVAFDYALKTRRAWTTFSSWRNKGKPAGLSIQNGTMTIVVTTHGGRAITTNNSLYPNASESEDSSCDVPEDTKLTDVWLAVMPSLPPVGTPRFGRRLFMGRLRLRVRNAATFAPLPAVKTALARGIARSLEVSEELVNVTSVIVVAAQGGRRLAALGELLVEYTVLQPEGSEEETSEHVEDLMEKANSNSTAVMLDMTNAMAEVAPDFAASVEDVTSTEIHVEGQDNGWNYEKLEDGASSSAQHAHVTTGIAIAMRCALLLYSTTP